MYLLETIPAVNIPREHPQILSYFSNEPVSRGTLILIPLRNKPTPAIVLSQTDISSQKTQLKKSSFTLKKINKIISLEPIFSEKEFIFLKWFADYYFLPLGLALKTILPTKLLKAKGPLKTGLRITNYELRNLESNSSLYFSDDRIDFYIQKIKENLKNNKQSLILFPEQINALSFFNQVNLIFEPNQISFLSGNLAPKKYLDEWLKIASNDTKIIIGARSAIFSKFSDLGLIIIDEEQDQSFKSWNMRPYYNSRECAIKLGEIFGAETILASSTPSIETYHKTKSRIHPPAGGQESKKSNYRSSTSIVASAPPYVIPEKSGIQTQHQIIDMRDEVRKGNEIISEDLAAELEKISQNSRQAILFINRRGSATFIFCRECGFSLHCKNCDVPIVFHKEIKGEKQLLCHHCGHREKSPDICPKCGGHKIRYSGIASQKAEEKIKELFPDLKIKRLDSETVLSTQDIQKAISDFKEKRVDIILGTQIILNKDFPKADIVAVLSIDTILNLPEFRTDERIYQIINQLKKYRGNGGTFLLQTFKPESEIFPIALNSNFAKLYEREIEARKLFNYPPFFRLIKLTHRNSNPQLAFKESHKIAEKINVLSGNSENFKIIGPAAGFIPRIKNQYVYNIIIKSNLGIKDRNNILNIIPTKDWTIDIDPISLI
ncbi:MAG: Primosomal protein N [Parcubacteria group bacterium GW2011_GWD2_38_12]|uniref:Replication restart protein PriA n=1 Tax=Candidatus Azambacteria bacterium RIFCSPLOWO2_01_FULL_37_9 TaxID=1797297 RepID=A0A1F5C5X9_9BACT|nr:MAG: Primosomal protein N [Parcubacteria group bacterium GW2011_GWC2_36_17]KKQ42377.1 MAG: Primosomal protein N [Parcubacteria group bacterium GW2011_GWE2_37_8]KKQ52895.1 MAG: Primosomal protein N [Parcubacteria group bacterium GW2011_GWD2_38_12]KKQ59098.1 MAG: Primosomal protein N [Parcubacteria group bacterium GW2011_GWC1_38_17]KKQ59713.1 MAG: Primosomal protein N [Parcubacteria group bacterium GW2011_GWD1_38_16]OGD38225.1 MAG: primosomal protein N' [Candidatus Azambacteria bacterium RIFC